MNRAAFMNHAAFMPSVFSELECRRMLFESAVLSFSLVARLIARSQLCDHACLICVDADCVAARTAATL